MGKRQRNIENNMGIYCWYCKVSKKRYIGRSIDLQERYKEFINFDKKYSGCKINNARKKYSDIKFWEYSILEYCDNVDMLNELEVYYIEKYDVLNCKKGYNEALGDLIIDYNRMYNNFINNWKPVLQYTLDGEFIRTYETVDELIKDSFDVSKICLSCFYKRRTIYSFLWRIKDYEGEVKTMISPDNSLAKCVYELDMNTGDLIKVHKSTRDASNQYGINIGTVHSAITKRETAYGRLWLYEEDANNKELIENLISRLNLSNKEKQRETSKKRNTFKSILQYDENGNFIKEWSFIADVKREMNLQINDALKTQSRKAGGYFWRYKESNNFPKVIDVSIYDREELSIVYKVSIETGEVVEEYLNSNDVEKLTKNNEQPYKSRSVRACLSGDRLTYMGFIWVYKRDYSPEHIQNIQQRIKNYNMNRNGFAVLQIDKNTDEVIKEWPTAAEAELFFTGKDTNSSIVKACFGIHQKTAFGYKWRYVNEEVYEIMKKRKDSTNFKRSLRLLQYDENGHFIKEWKTYTEAEDSLNLHNIRNGVRYKRMVGDFIWIKSSEIEEYINPQEFINQFICYQINPETREIIAEYKSALFAAESLSNNERKIDPDRINEAVNKKILFLDSIWILKKNYSDEKVIEILKKLENDFVKKYGLPVKQIDIETGTVIKVWKCAYDAEMAICGKYCNPRIKKVCAGKARTAYSFKWEYVE